MALPANARVPTYTPLAAFQHQGGGGGGAGSSSSSGSSVSIIGGGTGGAELVPIRLDVDVGGHRLVDSFLIDPTDPHMGPEQVRYIHRIPPPHRQPHNPPRSISHAHNDNNTQHTQQWAARLVSDLELPGGPHAQREVAARVAQSIRAQLAAYAYASHLQAAGQGPTQSGGGGGGPSSSVLVPLALRVRGAGLVYEDTVEWDVGAAAAEAGNAPERFAMRTVADLGVCLPACLSACPVYICVK
jgi:hypothetical protein